MAAEESFVFDRPARLDGWTEAGFFVEVGRSARLTLGVLPSGVLLATMLALFIACTSSPASQTVLQETASAVEMAIPSAPHSEHALGRNIQVLEDTAGTSNGDSCAQPTLSKITLKHGSSWSSAYSFEGGKEGGTVALGELDMSADDLVWRNGTAVISSTTLYVPNVHHSDGGEQGKHARRSSTSTDVWHVVDCQQKLIAKIKATDFQSCQPLPLLSVSFCQWESSNFSIHDDRGELIGSLLVERRHEFDALSLTDGAGATQLATIQAIAAGLSTIRGQTTNESVGAAATDARVLTALMVQVQQKVVSVVNLTSVNSVAFPILGFCVVYLVFSVCALAWWRGSNKRLSGALVVNVVVVVLVAVATLVTQGVMNPTA